MNLPIMPAVFIALDFIWFISGFLIFLLALMVFSSMVKLTKYPGDRRRHFYPLQLGIIIISALHVITGLTFSIAGHQPPTPLFNVSPIFIQVASLACFLIVIMEVIFQKRLPLTENQKRYRKT